MTKGAAIPIDFSALFQPRSVAVVGSGTPGKPASTVVRNLVRWGFQGDIFPINREGASLDGYRGYRRLADLPTVPDCAMVVVPAQNCPDVLQQCADLGVRFAIIGASGFAELQTLPGLERQRAIEEIARQTGLHLVGPNTNGVFNAIDGVSIGYSAAYGERFKAGNISIVSHSGALFDGLVRRIESLGRGLARFIPVGNEADLTMLDFLEFLIDDAATGVIGLVIEGLGDGARFRQLAARARANGKPIIALKVGRSEAGMSATLAHSSRLAGASRAYDALMRECDVAAVTTGEALAGGCALLSLTSDINQSQDERIVIVTTSGAGGALVADVATERGLQLAGDRGEWDEQTAAALARITTSARIRNPIDLGSVGDWGKLGDILRKTQPVADGPVVVYAHTPAEQYMTDRLVEALIERRSATSAPTVILAPGGLPEPVESAFIESGVLVFHETAVCFDSLMCYYAMRRAPAKRDHSVPLERPNRTLDVGREVDAALSGGGMLSEVQSAAILSRFNIPIVSSQTVASRDDALSIAAALSGPVVLKALAPGIAHKHDYGFVKVGLSTPDSLLEAYDAMERRVLEAGFKRPEVTFILQPMIAGELELIAGTSWEGPLGHFLVFGLGGVLAELLDEVVLLPIPIDTSTLRARIHESRAGHLLKKMIREPQRIIDQVVSALDALQSIVVEHGDRISSIDVNPLLVSDAKVVALDALVVAR